MAPWENSALQSRFDAEHNQANTLISNAAVYLSIIASLYNALLAIANANGVAITMAISASVEFLLLGSGMALVLSGRGLTRQDWMPIALLFVFALLALGLSIANDRMFPDMLRHIAIISVFCLLGLRVRNRALHAGLVFLATIVLAGLLLELINVDLYTNIFQPAMYFSNSRGIERPIWLESGLFSNSLGFESRFSFGLSDHRTSSIFLEQVSLANFAAVISIILLILWDELRYFYRIYYAFIILMIILSNSTRTVTTLALCSIVGFFVYPKLPRYGSLLICPLILLSAIIYIVVFGFSNGDDLGGRITLTIRKLANFDLFQLLGLRLNMSEELWDSGFAYIPTVSSIFGFLALWLFICFAMPQTTPAGKRGAYALGLYFFLNLMIGGNAVFSMKVAAPLWLVVGYSMRKQQEPPFSRSESR